MRCDECFFYSHFLSVCKARPPRISADLTAPAWPPMQGSDWCGAHKTDKDLEDLRRQVAYMEACEERGKVPESDRAEFDRRLSLYRGRIAERVSR